MTFVCFIKSVIYPTSWSSYHTFVTSSNERSLILWQARPPLFRFMCLWYVMLRPVFRRLLSIAHPPIMKTRKLFTFLLILYMEHRKRLSWSCQIAKSASRIATGYCFMLKTAFNPFKQNSRLTCRIFDYLWKKQSGFPLQNHTIFYRIQGKFLICNDISWVRKLGFIFKKKSKLDLIRKMLIVCIKVLQNT